MHTLFEAFTLGLVGGLVPGAVLTMILVSVLQGGFRLGLRTFFYCVLAEVVIVSLLLLTVLSLPLPYSTFHVVGLIGGLFLLYFAWQVAHIQSLALDDQSTSVHQVFTPFKIFLLSATNAPLYIFWLTVCLPLMLQLGVVWQSTAHAVMGFMAAFEVGWILSTFVLLILFIKARSYLTHERYVQITFRLLALLLGLLALRLWFTSLRSLGWL